MKSMVILHRNPQSFSVIAPFPKNLRRGVRKNVPLPSHPHGPQRQGDWKFRTSRRPKNCKYMAVKKPFSAPQFFIDF